MALTDSEYQPQPAADGESKKAPPEIIEIGDPKQWKRVSTPCKGGEHQIVVDSTERQFTSYKCVRCKIGWLFKTGVTELKSGIIVRLPVELKH